MVCYVTLEKMLAFPWLCCVLVLVAEVTSEPLILSCQTGKDADVLSVAEDVLKSTEESLLEWLKEGWARVGFPLVESKVRVFSAE